MMQIERGLKEEDTRSIVDVVCNNCLAGYPKTEAIMFNPMGMAVFDVAIGKYYLDVAKKMGFGLELE
jgi:ornithine cyclodeaminase